MTLYVKYKCLLNMLATMMFPDFYFNMITTCEYNDGC